MNDSNELLTDYLDGSLPEAARADVERLVADDPATARILEEARDGRDLLRDLPAQRPPRDFLRKVQRRVRRRSGGRYFHPATQPFGYRLTVEVFAVIAVVVMAACYFMLHVPPEVTSDLREVPPENAAAPPTPE